MVAGAEEFRILIGKEVLRLRYLGTGRPRKDRLRCKEQDDAYKDQLKNVNNV